ncbi:unnamed protein product [Camellia sinensis]
MSIQMGTMGLGQHEGQELDKIFEGLITFTRIFSPEAACEVIEAEGHSHVFYEPEPDIWMVMIVEKNFLIGKKLHSITGQSIGIMCWEYTVLLTDLVSGPASVHNSFPCMEDTINVFTYAVLRLSPRALSSGVSSWSYLRKGSVSSHAAPGSISANTGAVLDQFSHSPDTSSGGDRNYRVARPLQHDKWTKGNDGFLVTNIWNAEAGSVVPTTPTIWLQQTEERMYLCAFQHRNLTLILLIPTTSILNREQGISMVKQQVLENASLKIFKVEEKLSKGWGGENAYHVSGYHYLLVDGDRNVTRASPPAKVTTLPKESLVALSKLREEVDLEKSRAKWDGPNCEKDLEICIRAKKQCLGDCSGYKREETLYGFRESQRDTSLCL